MPRTPSEPASVAVRGIDRIQRLIEGALFVLMATMVVMVFLNVVLRFIFSTGIPQSEELSRYAFVWLTFLGAVVLVREGGHMGMDSFLVRLSPAGQRICRIASDMLIGFCCALLLVGSWHLTLSNVGKYSQASSFPMVLLFGVGLVAGVVMILFVAVDLWLVVTRQSGSPLQSHGAQVD